MFLQRFSTALLAALAFVLPISAQIASPGECDREMASLLPFGNVVCDLAETGEIKPQSLAGALTGPTGLRSALRGIPSGAGSPEDTLARLALQGSFQDMATAGTLLPSGAAPAKEPATGDPCATDPESLDCQYQAILGDLEAEYGSFGGEGQ
ncbi:MAG: hypothetical protein AAFR73_12095 [Pseudomonadota bacterium]